MIALAGAMSIVFLVELLEVFMHAYDTWASESRTLEVIESNETN